MLKEVRLHGFLGDMFGKSFKLDVETVAEAVKALSIQIQGFEHFMANAHLQGIYFTVYLDERNINVDDIGLSTQSSVIRISPIVDGQKKGGVFQVIVGVVMIAAAFYTGGTSLAAWGALQAGLAGAGAALLLGGAAQMMMPSALSTLDQNQDGNKANSGFGGAVTTVSQGLPVPILYGKRSIGGFVISFKQTSMDVL